jgi:hypothetical protein
MTTYHPVPPSALQRFGDSFICPDCGATPLLLYELAPNRWIAATAHERSCPSFDAEVGKREVARVAAACGLTNYRTKARRVTYRELFEEPT